MADTAENQRAKIIDITELLRKGQEESKSEIVTTRHAIQSMDNSISDSLTSIGNSVDVGFKSLADKIKVSIPESSSPVDLTKIESSLFAIEGWVEHIHVTTKESLQGIIENLSINLVTIAELLDGIGEVTTDILNKIGSGSGGFFATLGNTVLGGLGTLGKSLLGGFSTIKSTLVSLLPSKEEREEAGRDKGGAPTADSGGGGADKKGGFLKGLLKFPIKMIGSLFKGLSYIGGLFLKFGKFLLKPFLFLLAPVGAALTSTGALIAGLIAIAALFAGVAVASFTMTDAEFDALKEKIAKGIAGAISKFVVGAMKIWNEFTPEAWNISEEEMKSFETATFKTVHDTIIGIIDFAKDIVDAFGKGFTEKMEPFKKAWDNFKIAFQKVVDAFSGTDIASGVKSTTVSVAEKVGGIVASIATFFLDLSTALLGLTVGETDVTDNKAINTAAGIIKSIVLFIKDLAVSFGEGFASTFEGISDKFTSLKEKMGQVADKVGEMFTTVGEGAQDNKKTLKD